MIWNYVKSDHLLTCLTLESGRSHDYPYIAVYRYHTLIKAVKLKLRKGSSPISYTIDYFKQFGTSHVIAIGTALNKYNYAMTGIVTKMDEWGTMTDLRVVLGLSSSSYHYGSKYMNVLQVHPQVTPTLITVGKHTFNDALFTLLYMAAQGLEG